MPKSDPSAPSKATTENINHLIQIDDKHWLHPATHEAFLAMRQAAKNDGICIDIASSYRSVERQLAIWNAKWEGKRMLYQRDMTPVNAHDLSDEEKLHCILTFSALPAASRHHWGTDLDVYDAQAMAKAGLDLELVESEYIGDGPCAPLHHWLLEHANTFGFSFPYAEDKGGIAKEPWHISHTIEAQRYMAALTLTELEKHIQNMPILGKESILQHLPLIYRQYVLNEGIE
ncbi:M15 family metallopeptidase [Alteromonas sp. a30]|uniref:M15 family metallopeptidase n=1 Tax=Alteromonas sp. a30 TaxID=2730917 RepID=UPI00228266F4|nr:M15 family metallopeptidase [Alteromonas sp. a30]MCY7296360.1 M15 family metallopeptidase [Alteromonas sp. a30]